METTTCSTPASCCETQRAVVTDASIIGLTPDPLWNARNEVIDYSWKNDAQPVKFLADPNILNSVFEYFELGMF